MNALRAGLKRIDNKNKERKGKHTSSDELIDRSSLPILGFEDSYETSPAKNPIIWETNTLQDDVNLTSGNLLADTGRFQSTCFLNQRIGSHPESFVGNDSIDDLPGDNSYVVHPERQQIDEFDENRPPDNNRSKSKVMKFTRWKKSAKPGESEQPLLVESSLANTSKGMDIGRFTSHPRNLSRWDPIEHDETTEPLGQISTNHSKGIMSSRLHINHETRATDNSVKQKIPTQSDNFDSGAQTNSKKVTQVRATFDPFEDFDEVERELSESAFQQQHNFSTVSKNSFRNRTAHTYRGQEINSLADNIQRSEANHEFDRSGNPRFSVDNFKNQRAPNADSDSPITKDINLDYEPDHFSEGLYPAQEDCFERNREKCTHQDELTQTQQLDPIRHVVYDPKRSASRVEFAKAQYGRDTCQQEDDFCIDDIDRTEENLMKEEDKGFETSTDVIGEMYSVRKMEHIRSIYDSKFRRAVSDLQEKDTEEMDRSIPPSSHFATDEDGGNYVGLRLVALISEFSGTLKQRTEQERAVSILDAKRISNVEKVDGSSQCNKDRRNRLFDISGERGKYPQFFLQKDPNIIIYLGDFEWLQYMNDIGSLNDETIFGESRSTSELNESAQIKESNNVEVDGHISFSDRAVAFDIFKKEQFADGESPVHRDDLIRNVEVDSLNSQDDDFVISSGSRFVSETSSQTDIDSHIDTDIQSIDDNHIIDSKDSIDSCDTDSANKQLQSGEMHYEELFESTKSHCNPCSLTIAPEGITENESSPTSEALTAEIPTPKSELNDSCETEDLPCEQSEDNLNTAIAPSSYGGRHDEFAFSEPVPDSIPKAHEVQSSSSSIKSKRESITCNTTNDEEDIFSDIENHSEEDETGGEIPVRDSSLSDETGTCSDLEKSQPLNVERDEMSKEETEKLRRRRARWKRRIMAEHLGMKSSDISENSSNQADDPIGASMTELEMINKFLTLLGPDFDGSLSPKELDGIYRQSENAGLTKEFTDKMLNQSVGMNTENDTDTESRQLYETLSSVDETYDDHGFTRKTPKVQSRMGCLIDTFWAESSNIVGGDMVENIQAALSGDSDGKWEVGSAKSSESKSRWRSRDVIDNIKASFSGDSAEKGWRSVDVIGNIKASLSGEGSEGGWRSADVIGSIRAALSSDSECKDGASPSDDSNQNTQAALTPNKDKYTDFGEGMKSHIAEIDVEDTLVDGSLHEC